MSSARHSAHLHWSPLRPPLVRLAPAQPQDTAPPVEVEAGGDAAAVDRREGRPVRTAPGEG